MCHKTVVSGPLGEEGVGRGSLCPVCVHMRGQPIPKTLPVGGRNESQGQQDASKKKRHQEYSRH